MEPEPMSGCWIWTGSHDTCGYGRMGLAGHTTSAHRIAYEHWRGPIPAARELDHLCRVRSCVNPGHLEPVEHRVNIQRGTTGGTHYNGIRPTCGRGHPYTPENTFVDRRGWRFCRACWRERYYRKRRGRLAAERRVLRET